MSNWLLQPAWVATGSLCDLPLEVFLDRGIKALVLDVDCTLLPRHSQVMPECVVHWVYKARQPAEVAFVQQSQSQAHRRCGACL